MSYMPLAASATEAAVKKAEHCHTSHSDAARAFRPRLWCCCGGLQDKTTAEVSAAAMRASHARALMRGARLRRNASTARHGS